MARIGWQPAADHGKGIGQRVMKLREALAIIEGEILSSGVALDRGVQMGCGADLMSDVLAFTPTGTLLMTGLANPRIVRTAEMTTISAIVFVRSRGLFHL